MSVRAIIIFLLSFALIMAGEHSPRKLDRPAAGLVGGVAMVLFGVLTRREAMNSINFPTLALLLGMMIVIHYATLSGLLNAMAEALLERSHNARQLIWAVCLVSGVLSALFINDTICLIMTPLLLSAVSRAGQNAEPFLLGLATSSNVGSVMTLTGNPQNILIGQSSSWTWGAYALRMIPIGVVCLVINCAIIVLLYRKSLSGEKFSLKSIGQSAAIPLQPKLAYKVVLVLAGLLVAFLSGLPLDLSALVAAAILLVWANHRTEDALNAVDWPLLLFFAGLFVIVEGITKTQGHRLSQLLPALTQQPGSIRQLASFSFGSVVASNIFSNVPFVMLLRGSIATLPHARLIWLVLAMSSTFAGNLTMIGSVANLIVAQRAKEECHLSFWAFLRVGVPSTIFTTLAGILILWIYHLLHWA